MIIDMHTHTSYSDGLYSPTKLIDQAIKKNLSGIAITDHDSIDGLEEAMSYVATKNNFILVPGIEFGCEYDNKEIHLLGYFVDYKNADLIEASKLLKSWRVQRGEKMVENLNKLGFDLAIEDVRKIARDDYIGRPHIARALVKKKLVKDFKEAFEKYLKRGAPAFVERSQLSIGQSIELINRANGLSVLAHPALIGDNNLIEYVISLGVQGIECYHTKHLKTETKELIEIAKDKDLIITGGSDYHGDEDILGDCYTDFSKNSILMGRVRND